LWLLVVAGVVLDMVAEVVPVDSEQALVLLSPLEQITQLLLALVGQGLLLLELAELPGQILFFPP
jgi:hypothetical protein